MKRTRYSAVNISALLMLCLSLLLGGCVGRGNVSPSQLAVHFIDVGQADAVLIQCEEKNMLIDAGSNETGKTVVEYLEHYGVNELEIAIGTHPHEDHIGGMDEIISKVKVGELLLTDFEADTKTNMDVFDAAKKRSSNVKVAHAGDEFILGGAKIEILGPIETDSDANNMSLVVRLTYGENVFLFMGDAEKESEEAMLASHKKLECDVLKVGHHGSSTSSSYLFLRAANPSYAVISCEKGNQYGFPHQETLSRLNDVGAEVFRTDLLGNIVAHSDGKRITFDGQGIEPTRPHNEHSKLEEIVIGNRNTKKYHQADCNLLPDQKNRVIFAQKEEAEKAGYTPHDHCTKS